VGMCRRMSVDNFHGAGGLLMSGWVDFICPQPNGHTQAVGVDVARPSAVPLSPGLADQARPDEVRPGDGGGGGAPQSAGFDPRASRWTAAGRACRRDRRTPSRPRLSRIVANSYADAKGSFGLTTLAMRRVRRSRGRLVVWHAGKSGIEHCIEIYDPLAVSAVDTMRRRGGGDSLVAYHERRRWNPMDAATVNGNLRETTGAEIAATDFRAWHATVLVAVSPASSDSPATRKPGASGRYARRWSRCRSTSATLRRSRGSRTSVIDLYEDGTTIAPRRCVVGTTRPTSGTGP
jgi:DNA topoisomerase I